MRPFVNGSYMLLHCSCRVDCLWAWLAMFGEDMGLARPVEVG